MNLLIQFLSHFLLCFGDIHKQTKKRLVYALAKRRNRAANRSIHGPASKTHEIENSVEWNVSEIFANEC